MAPAALPLCLCFGLLAASAGAEAGSCASGDVACGKLDLKALTERYFDVWNSHDKKAIQDLHAEKSLLKDWNGEHGPTNIDVSRGIAEIWSAVPGIRIAILDIYTSVTNTCVATILVLPSEAGAASLKVVDVIEYDDAGLVVSIHA
eukprot:TRINITY_DN56754_c0_g1_i1.p1 TRINITY_DN56754_c0_g1~~TRINITY_DN56754_c0_g1_i1.p1  ORF type:complete len:155 (-),score=32.96 TRINITY_DN56754_c0_g1_i1:66-503(-)